MYGVTRGLRDRFGSTRVFDTLLDEQTVLGTALGTSLAGFVPVPEIQYLAYLHNAEDQLRGEAASLRFFSDGQYANGMVVRIPGLAYQKGFGGHFHNDNSLAVLRDIPGIAVAVASHPHSAPGLLRGCLDLARDGRVCVYVEPIARYHTPRPVRRRRGLAGAVRRLDPGRPRRRGGLRHRAGPAPGDVRQRGLHEPPGGRDAACRRLRLHGPRPRVGGAAPRRGPARGGLARGRRPGGRRDPAQRWGLRGRGRDARGRRRRGAGLAGDERGLVRPARARRGRRTPAGGRDPGGRRRLKADSDCEVHALRERAARRRSSPCSSPAACRPATRRSRTRARRRSPSRRRRRRRSRRRTCRC